MHGQETDARKTYANDRWQRRDGGDAIKMISINDEDREVSLPVAEVSKGEDGEPSKTRNKGIEGIVQIRKDYHRVNCLCISTLGE